MTGLREAILLGIKRSDGTVLFPPTEYDPQNSESLHEMVEVGQEGTVSTWTWVEKPRDQSPWELPHALALIQLDQTDTPFLHAVLVDDVTQMMTGMRVTIQWRDEREGHIHDIEGFVPLEGSSV